MSGCLRGVLRLGCLAFVLAAGAAGWWFRDPLLRAASRWIGDRGSQHTALPPAADTTVGAPTPGALHSTQSKIDRLRKPSGPDSVVLTADEVASLVGSGIDWSVRKSFDSLRVELLEGSIAVYCRLDTRVIPPNALGPLTGMLRPMEPLRIAGPVRIERPGVGRWTIAELTLRGIAFPDLMVKQLAQRIAGATADGAVPLRMPPAFQDLAIHPAAVILYRQRRRP